MTTPATVAEIDAELTGPGGPFEIETIEIDGRPTRTWKHAPRAIGDILDRGCELAGPHDLVVAGDERLSHDAHRARARRLADVLVDEFGVRKGDRVAIAMRNVPEWSVAFFAAVLAGAIATPLNAFWNGAELAFATRGRRARGADRRRRAFRAAADARRTRSASVALIGTRLDDRKTDAPLPSGDRRARLAARRAARTHSASTSTPTTWRRSSTRRGPRAIPRASWAPTATCAPTSSASQFVAARGARCAPGVTPPPPPTPPVVALVPVPLFHGTGLPLRTWSHRSGPAEPSC